MLLARHAKAVLARSESGYLGDVDTTTAAAAFRAQERSDLTNLARVPLAGWSYTGVRAATDATATSAAAERYGAPTLIVHVTLNYRLRSVDTLPSPHTLYLSLVRRDGRVLLAGDSDLASAGSPSWAGPWRFGPLAVARGSSALVLGPPAAALDRVADAVDRAVTAVTAVWGTGWNRQVAVLVSAGPAEFSALTGEAGQERLGDVSAAAVTDGVDPVSHRPFGQRLVLAPTALATLSAVGEQIVLRHELTHLATAAITDPSTPRWIVEGFADYVGNLGSGQLVGVAASELRTSVRAGMLPDALPADQAFGAGGAPLAQVYEQSWLACRLIAARAGQDALVRFYRTAAGALLPAEEAVSSALQTALQETLAQFTAQWRAYLRDQLA